MKTLPAVRLADTTEAAMLPNLPEGVRSAMTGIAGAAREGRSAKAGGWFYVSHVNCSCSSAVRPGIYCGTK